MPTFHIHILIKMHSNFVHALYNEEFKKKVPHAKLFIGNIFRGLYFK